MIVKVVLFGTFRERLPRELRGRTTLELPEGSPLRAVLEHFDLPPNAACAVNGQLEPDRERILQDGDEIQVFRPAGGGNSSFTKRFCLCQQPRFPPV
ncbi:MAG: MoaD/ThiS family protein [Anaerolineales bacterium]|nr:MoaD/ThiS family protein [Anaerolineales bacterium]MDW8446684.1 MoaD/ThiS family protein [Anaerolineales bacterium]